MLTDIHGVDPAEFRATLDDSSREGSAKKRRKHDSGRDRAQKEYELGQDQSETKMMDVTARNLDIHA